MQEKCVQRLEIPDDRSLIVVSDLHLGGDKDPGTSERFCRFLEFLRDRYQRNSVYCQKCRRDKSGGEGCRKHLLPPEKIILLGDILELWDSRRQDRNNAFLDILRPLDEMKEIDCDIVYVTGNHDEDISEIIASFAKDRQNSPNPGGRTTYSPGEVPEYCRLISSKKADGSEKPESLTFYRKGKRTIELCARHYPAPRLKGGELGIASGGVRYAFIHGQQFDREQIPYTISEALGQRFDPVDYIQDLANVSLAKQIGTTGIALITVMFGIFATILYFSKIQSAIPIPLVGYVTGGLLTVIFLVGAFIFGFKTRTLSSAGSVAGLCLLVSLLSLGALWFGLLKLLFFVGAFVSTSAFAVIALPRVCTFLMGKFYKVYSSSKNRMTDDIITENRFDASKYRYASKVLVFGHTHKADFTRHTKNEKVKLLVNTGSWVKENNDEYDTFVYIDKDGICCMRWIDDENEVMGEIKCLCRDKDGSLDVPLCDYIARNQLNLSE